jgi:hypothetical protein
MATRLKGLDISEVSLVDRGANQFAKVKLFKRDGGADMEPNEALIDSIASILEDDELDEPARNRMLIDSVAQYIVFTGGDLATIKPGAPKARTMAGPQSPDIVIADMVKRVANGEKTDLSRGFFETLAKVQGERDRRAGETVEQARARFHATAEGRLLRKATERAPIRDAAPQAHATRGPAMRALHKRADDLCAVDRGLTRAKAVAKIAEASDPRDRALFAAAHAEERGRAAA